MPVIDKLAGVTGLSGLHLLLGAVGVTVRNYLFISSVSPSQHIPPPHLSTFHIDEGEPSLSV